MKRLSILVVVKYISSSLISYVTWNDRGLNSLCYYIHMLLFVLSLMESSFSLIRAKHSTGHSQKQIRLIGEYVAFNLSFKYVVLLS